MPREPDFTYCFCGFISLLLGEIVVPDWDMFHLRFPTHIDDAENHTSESHGPRTLLMAPAQQEEETILAEGTGVVPAKCSPKIKSELFSLL